VIEQAMIFALGFLVAGLLALAFVPAVWARANRLTRRQLEMQIPLSVQEILAERDQLRAEFAVERCRLDQRVAQLSDRHAGDLAQLGQLVAQLSQLQDDVATGAHALKESEAAAAHARSELFATQAELGAVHKAFYDAEGLLERRQAEFLEYVRMQESMKLLAEARFAALAASDARVASLELRLGDVSRNLIEAEQKITQKELHTRSLVDAMGDVRHDREHAESKNTRLQERLDFEIRRTAQLTEEFAALRRQHDDSLGQLRSLMVKVNVGETAIEDAKRREKDILAQRDMLVERAREAERAASDKYVHLRSEFAAMQGALDVARQRCTELESRLARHTAVAEQKGAATAAAPAPPDDTAMLRQSIREVGESIVKMMRANGSGDAAAHAPTAPAAPGRLPPASVPQLLKPDAERVASHEPAPTP
jgi:chromosome segregation ATPase